MAVEGLEHQGVSGPSSSCVWNPRVFADDARGWQCPFVLCAEGSGAGGVQTAKASRKQSSLSGKESAQGCIPKRLLGRPDETP